jgi:hypothetical protein
MGELSCADRVESALSSRLASLVEWEAEYGRAEEAGDDERMDEVLEAVREWPLCIERKATFWLSGDEADFHRWRVQLSTGGPGDWFDIDVDASSGRVVGAEYVFQDWFDSATADSLDPADLEWFATTLGLEWFSE